MNRIRELRKEKGISMKEAAQQLQMPYTTYVNYETGAREPNSETLIQIASFYGTSIDYLLGREPDSMSMVSETMGDRIKKCRQAQNITLRELAQSVGIPHPTVQRYESGQALRIDYDTILRIANALRVSPTYLAGWEESTAAGDSTDGIVPIRYLGEVAAGFDHIAYEEYEYLNVPEEWLHGHPASDYFAMRVTGSSMYPEYRDGDEILCLHCDDMGRSGRVGVFVYGEEATLKKIEYVHGEDWVDLVPINPEYETKRIEGADLEHCRVIGRAVRLIRTINQ